MLLHVMFYSFLAVLLLLVTIIITFLLLQIYIKKRKSDLSKKDVINVGLFHPFCIAGGGGERVLWCAVKALQKKYDNINIIIYTGDNDTKRRSILVDVKKIFNIDVDEANISFAYLKQRKWVEASHYRYFTLLGQSIGSIILGLEAIFIYPPDVYIDTTGFAFTLPIFRFLGGCKVGCYVHYPTISTDMLRRVQNREYVHNNQLYVARNPLLTWLKLLYYTIFAKIYSLSGICSDSIMVNSTWTEYHILELWKAPFKTHRVYPPCDVNHIRNIEHIENTNEVIIISVGQFRPEKDHPLQLQIMYELRSLLSNDEELWNKIRFVIIGSCRNENDYERVKNIQDLCKHLSLENSVEFRVNIDYNEILQLYQRAMIGIHTMLDEHFGIAIVECMAAGLIMIAHRSGGPLLDIIDTSDGNQNGYLAITALEYATCILNILHCTQKERDCIRLAARSSAEKFSEKEFEVNFVRALAPLFNK